jgi:serine/threonine-protein kinase HipA
MINAAEIYLWGTKIGTVWQPEEDSSAVFEYEKTFLGSRIEVSPFEMPLSERIYRFPELSRLDAFRGLPGLLADSLPDRFGNAVINEWLERHGRDPESFTAIERLCYTGKRGMGALEFMPSVGPVASGDEVDVNEMAEFASEILSGRKSEKLSDRELSLARLIEIGSSAGGARAKAVIAWNPKTGEIRSGQVELGRDFQHWLIKFDGVDGNGDRGVTDSRQHTRIEYAYYLMAKKAGITMNECRIYESEGDHHFMTKRFDRVDGKKLHMQSLGALAHISYQEPGVCGYELAAMYMKELGISYKEIEQFYRRMVFNCLAVNQDDHVKNISFIMDRTGKWSLSPAYDITFSYNPTNKWLRAHQMSVNGKTLGIGYPDLMEAGNKMGIKARRCSNIISEVEAAIAEFQVIANQVHIKEKTFEYINKVINENKILK